MPSYIDTVSRKLSANFGNVLNIGVIILTYFESYLFPLAIFKLLIVVTKYGGVISRLRKEEDLKKAVKTRYKYKLQLLTIENYVLPDNRTVERISNVSMIIEEEEIQLSYCGQDCRRIPPALQKMYGGKVRCLDLSYNSIETLKGLEQFGRLEELILDNNKLGDAITFPYLSNLRTLSLNNNEIIDLEELVNKICKHFPSLTYLSLLSNKACPNQLSDSDKDDSDYQRYRYFVIHMIPNLRFLDSRRVSSAERKEAAIRGEFMRVRRPPSDVFDAPVVPAPQTRLRPLPVDLGALGKHKGAYGKCNYKYTGKHSEGNRFILNSDL
ncbi:leucine-rich melanocyte differentiation-associated protein-like isoform X1 [Helicoverpa zea]|uniref:leucine-rich melanocyte differentiation-associated protein-like isoform X1 n=1 Tax=Helicoverpa zea TaxID=7113 RepID=UPI001F58C6D3|nr:leucine-rich melanocyte differentiation-associated protein-like isoform X1 [Helicoverpa zea]